MADREFVERKASEFSRRFDSEDLRLAFQGRGLRLTTRFGKTYVPDDALNELTDKEVEFGVAREIAQKISPFSVAFPFLLLPWLICGGIGLALVYANRSDLVGNYPVAFSGLFFSQLVGYLLGTQLEAKIRSRQLTQVYHDALSLTGDPLAAESYLLRSAGDKPGVGQLSYLETQLAALREASDQLGLEYSRLARLG